MKLRRWTASPAPANRPIAAGDEYIRRGRVFLAYSTVWLNFDT
jgi:hypothetical protein